MDSRVDDKAKYNATCPIPGSEGVHGRLFGHPEHQFNFFSHQIGGARSKDHEPSFQFRQIFRLWAASGAQIGLLCDRPKLVNVFS